MQTYIVQYIIGLCCLYFLFYYEFVIEISLSCQKLWAPNTKARGIEKAVPRRSKLDVSQALCRRAGVSGLGLLPSD